MAVSRLTRIWQTLSVECKSTSVAMRAFADAYGHLPTNGQPEALT